MPSKKRARAGLSSNDEARSAAASACSSGFDDVDGSPECAVYIQMRGIEQVRVRRGFKGGGRPVGVALVAAPNILKNVGLVYGAPGRLQLGRASPGARLRARGDEDLYLSIRK